ncbi:MAG TPA: hypothetical protein VGJ95_06820 [Pseudonocardiaceae bacterium]|jgi:hypothetical protein
MAGTGPPPKDPATRRRRNADPIPTTTLTADGEVRGPDLPDGRDWPDETRSWWETWRNSPQSQAFTDTDWDFLLDTALLHSRFWRGDDKVASELRLRVAKFGATPEDRMRLRLQIDEDDVKPAQSGARPGGRYGHLRTVKTG